MNRSHWIGSSLLLLVVISIGVALAAWKYAAKQDSAMASANQPEPIEAVMAAVAKEIEHRPMTTSIGTILAMRSITLRNELPGTVRLIRLTPGQIVDPGEVLVKLDVSIEEAELKAQQAEAAFAKIVLDRRRDLRHDLATAQEEVDRARADLNIALAQIARTKAVIDRKTIRAPFRAKVGIADVHPGQYLNEGTQLTTLQGLGDAVHVDFMIPQQVAANLKEGESVAVGATNESSPILATIVALDSRIDPTTRNTIVRAKITPAAGVPAPGASVRVTVPTGPPRKAVAVPASALRKGPGGNQVYVIERDQDGQTRAYARQVDSGEMLGDEVVIYAGLSAGEQIAASGSFKLHDGVLVVSAQNPGGEKEQKQMISRAE